MSGIFGYFSLGDKEEVQPDVTAMASFLTHMPEDQVDFFQADGLRIGSVHNGAGLNHPIYRDPSSGRILALDGTIIGLPSPDTANPGHQLEAIARLIDRQGPAVVSDLAGDFNLLVADPARRTCWLISDRYGFRRMYYFINDSIMVFAPEVKAILVAHESAGRETDEEAFADYFNYGYPLGNKTFFRKIRLLGPASWLEFGSHGAGERKYWQFEPQHAEDPPVDFEDAVRQTRDLWHQSIRRCLPDGSIRAGCALSGGLDSRLIACSAAEYRPDLQTYTYGRKNSLDVRIASRVAQTLDLPHRIVIIDPECFHHYSERAVWLTEGMAYVPNALQLSTYPTVSPLFDVHLSGFAGDLTLGGSFIQPENLNRICHEEEIVDNFLRRMAQFSSDRFLNSLFSKEFSDFIKSRLRKNIKGELARIPYKTRTLNQNREDFFINQHCRRYINQISLQKYFSCDRKPFFDYDLIDYTFSLPEEYRLEHRLFFAIFKDMYPEQAAIEWQKTGGNCYRGPSRLNKFLRDMKYPLMYYIGRATHGKWNPTNPFDYEHYNQWYRRSPRQQRQLADVLLDPATIGRGYYKRDGVAELLRMQKEGGMYFYLLAALYNFEMWHRQFLPLGPGSKNPWEGRILS